MREYLAILDDILPEKLASMPMFFLSPFSSLIADDLGSMFGFPEILPTITRVKANPLPRLNLIQIGQAGNKNCFGVTCHDTNPIKRMRRRKGERLSYDRRGAVKVYPSRHNLTVSNTTFVIEGNTEHIKQIITRCVAVNKNFFFHA